MMDITKTVLQTLANRIGSLEVENTCLTVELQALQEQMQSLKQNEKINDES